MCSPICARDKYRYSRLRYSAVPGLTGRVIAPVLLSCRPTAGRVQDQPTILSWPLVLPTQTLREQHPLAHAYDTTSTSHARPKDFSPLTQPRCVERCNSLCPVLALSLAYPAFASVEPPPSPPQQLLTRGRYKIVPSALARFRPGFCNRPSKW